MSRGKEKLGDEGSTPSSPFMRDIPIYLMFRPEKPTTPWFPGDLLTMWVSAAKDVPRPGKAIPTTKETPLLTGKVSEAYGLFFVGDPKEPWIIISIGPPSMSLSDHTALLAPIEGCWFQEKASPRHCYWLPRSDKKFDSHPHANSVSKLVQTTIREKTGITLIECRIPASFRVLDDTHFQIWGPLNQVPVPKPPNPK